MTELIILVSILSIAVVAVILSPFFYGEGGTLQNASASDNLQDLQVRQSAILKRWIQDEGAAERGEISKTEWSQRQRYLTSRYVDVARRIHWIQMTSDVTDSVKHAGGAL